MDFDSSFIATFGTTVFSRVDFDVSSRYFARGIYLVSGIWVAAGTACGWHYFGREYDLSVIGNVVDGSVSRSGFGADGLVDRPIGRAIAQSD